MPPTTSSSSSSSSSSSPPLPPSPLSSKTSPPLSSFSSSSSSTHLVSSRPPSHFSAYTFFGRMRLIFPGISDYGEFLLLQGASRTLSAYKENDGTKIYLSKIRKLTNDRMSRKIRATSASCLQNQPLHHDDEEVEAEEAEEILKSSRRYCYKGREEEDDDDVEGKHCGNRGVHTDAFVGIEGDSRCSNRSRSNGGNSSAYYGGCTNNDSGSSSTSTGSNSNNCANVALLSSEGSDGKGIVGVSREDSSNSSSNSSNSSNNRGNNTNSDVCSSGDSCSTTNNAENYCNNSVNVNVSSARGRNANQKGQTFSAEFVHNSSQDSPQSSCDPQLVFQLTRLLAAAICCREAPISDFNGSSNSRPLPLPFSEELRSKKGGGIDAGRGGMKLNEGNGRGGRGRSVRDDDLLMGVVELGVENHQAQGRGYNNISSSGGRSLSRGRQTENQQHSRRPPSSTSSSSSMSSSSASAISLSLCADIEPFGSSDPTYKLLDEVLGQADMRAWLSDNITDDFRYSLVHPHFPKAKSYSSSSSLSSPQHHHRSRRRGRGWKEVGGGRRGAGEGGGDEMIMYEEGGGNGGLMSVDISMREDDVEDEEGGGGGRDSPVISLPRPLENLRDRLNNCQTKFYYNHVSITRETSASSSPSVDPFGPPTSFPPPSYNMYWDSPEGNAGERLVMPLVSLAAEGIVNSAVEGRWNGDGGWKKKEKEKRRCYYDRRRSMMKLTRGGDFSPGLSEDEEEAAKGNESFNQSGSSEEEFSEELGDMRRRGMGMMEGKLGSTFLNSSHLPDISKLSRGRNFFLSSNEGRRHRRSYRTSYSPRITRSSSSSVALQKYVDSVYNALHNQRPLRSVAAAAAASAAVSNGNGGGGGGSMMKDGNNNDSWVNGKGGSSHYNSSNTAASIIMAGNLTGSILLKYLCHTSVLSESAETSNRSLSVLVVLQEVLVNLLQKAVTQCDGPLATKCLNTMLMLALHHGSLFHILNFFEALWKESFLFDLSCNGMSSQRRDRRRRGKKINNNFASTMNATEFVSSDGRTDVARRNGEKENKVEGGRRGKVLIEERQGKMRSKMRCMSEEATAAYDVKGRNDDVQNVEENNRNDVEAMMSRDRCCSYRSRRGVNSTHNTNEETSSPSVSFRSCRRRYSCDDFHSSVYVLTRREGSTSDSSDDENGCWTLPSAYYPSLECLELLALQFPMAFIIPEKPPSFLQVNSNSQLLSTGTPSFGAYIFQLKISLNQQADVVLEKSSTAAVPPTPKCRVGFLQSNFESSYLYYSTEEKLDFDESFISIEFHHRVMSVWRKTSLLPSPPIVENSNNTSATAAAAASFSSPLSTQQTHPCNTDSPSYPNHPHPHPQPHIQTIPNHLSEDVYLLKPKPPLLFIHEVGSGGEREKEVEMSSSSKIFSEPLSTSTSPLTSSGDVVVDGRISKVGEGIVAPCFAWEPVASFDFRDVNAVVLDILIDQGGAGSVSSSSSTLDIDVNNIISSSSTYSPNSTSSALSRGHIIIFANGRPLYFGNLPFLNVFSSTVSEIQMFLQIASTYHFNFEFPSIPCWSADFVNELRRRKLLSHETKILSSPSPSSSSWSSSSDRRHFLIHPSSPTPENSHLFMPSPPPPNLYGSSSPFPLHHPEVSCPLHSLSRQNQMRRHLHSNHRFSSPSCDDIKGKRINDAVVDSEVDSSSFSSPLQSSSNILKNREGGVNVCFDTSIPSPSPSSSSSSFSSSPSPSPLPPCSSRSSSRLTVEQFLVRSTSAFHRIASRNSSQCLLPRSKSMFAATSHKLSSFFSSSVSTSERSDESFSDNQIIQCLFSICDLRSFTSLVLFLEQTCATLRRLHDEGKMMMLAKTNEMPSPERAKREGAEKENNDDDDERRRIPDVMLNHYDEEEEEEEEERRRTNSLMIWRKKKNIEWIVAVECVAALLLVVRDMLRDESSVLEEIIKSENKRMVELISKLMESFLFILQVSL